MALEFCVLNKYFGLMLHDIVIVFQ